MKFLVVYLIFYFASVLGLPTSNDAEQFSGASCGYAVSFKCLCWSAFLQNYVTCLLFCSRM